MPRGAKTLIILGAFFLFGGGIWWGWSNWQLPTIPLGRLPGDIKIEGKAGTVYIPITTCVTLSVLGSFLLWTGRKIFSLF